MLPKSTDKLDTFPGELSIWSSPNTKKELGAVSGLHIKVRRGSVVELLHRLTFHGTGVGCSGILLWECRGLPRTSGQVSIAVAVWHQMQAYRPTLPIPRPVPFPE